MHREVTTLYDHPGKSDGQETSITKVGWVLPDCYF